MTFSFGDFSLDTRTRQLLRRGREVHVSPKAFQLLTLLLENQVRAMSKAELHEQLWPSTFVQETNLAGLVAELRQALGDSAESPRYVRTLQRFGYWFIGNARRAEPETTSPKSQTR